MDHQVLSSVLILLISGSFFAWDDQMPLSNQNARCVFEYFPDASDLSSPEHFKALYIRTKGSMSCIWKFETDVYCWVITFERWLDLSGDNHNICVAVQVQRNQCTYTIVTSTGNIEGAGTTADVNMEFFDDNGNSVLFVNLNSQNRNLDQGATNTFTVVGACVWEICGMHLSHDDAGPDPSWFVNTVTVSLMYQSQVFNVFEWLSKTEPPYSLSRTISSCPAVRGRWIRKNGFTIVGYVVRDGGNNWSYNTQSPSCTCEIFCDSKPTLLELLFLVLPKIRQCSETSLMVRV